MALERFVIFAGADADAWHIGVARSEGAVVFNIEAPAEGSIDAAAQSVADLLQAQGYGGQGILLAIPSTWCLAATISTDLLPRKNQRQAMAYRLEEQLPLAAEEVVADFLPGDNGHVLGICVQIHTLAPVIEALENRGIAVQAICPAAVLAVQATLPTDEMAEGVLTGLGPRLDFFTVSNGAIDDWSLLTNRPDDLALFLGARAAADGVPQRITALGVDHSTVDHLRQVPEVGQVAVTETSMHAAATSAGEAILSGKLQPWIDLRRGALGVGDPYRQLRIPLTAAVAAMIVLLLVASATMLWRAEGYHQVADQQRAQQRVLFEEIFPGQRVPISVKARLASEERRLAGLSGQSTQMPSQTSALGQLRRVLTSLPNDLRFRVLELRIDPDQIYIDGQTRSHGDADTIAHALREQGEFQVDAPRTQRLREQGVGFLLSAQTTDHPKVVGAER